MEVFHFHLLPWTEIESEENAVWPFEDVPYDRERCADLYEDYFATIELADELGLDGVAFNEHHFSCYAMNPSPIVTASNVAARTENVKIGFMGNVIPIRGNPLRVAEELAQLDNFSRGRILSGFARGIPVEYLAYNVDRDESRARLREAWELIVEAWTAEEPFDWDGEFWQYENVNIWPKPYQEPHPPLCMPAESEESLRFAAEKRASIGQSGSPTAARDVFEQYREIAEEEFGWVPTDDDFILAKGIYVSETTEQARREIRDHLEYRWKILYAGIHKGIAARMAGDREYRAEKHKESMSPLGREAADFDFEEFVDNMIVGDPEHVLEQIERHYDMVGGFGKLFGGFQFGTLPAEKVERSMRLFSDHVLPEVQALSEE